MEVVDSLEGQIVRLAFEDVFDECGGEAAGGGDGVLCQVEVDKEGRPAKFDGVINQSPRDRSLSTVLVACDEHSRARVLLAERLHPHLLQYVVEVNQLPHLTLLLAKAAHVLGTVFVVEVIVVLDLYGCALPREYGQVLAFEVKYCLHLRQLSAEDLRLPLE